MDKIKLREPYRLSELVMIIKKAILANGIDKTLGYEDMYFCLYTKGFEDKIFDDTICYVENYPDINDEDEEIFPDFVVINNLKHLCSGEQFEDVIGNALHQKDDPSMEEFIAGLNYYRDHDSFLDL